jgi:hypothetical protein
MVLVMMFSPISFLMFRDSNLSNYLFQNKYAYTLYINHLQFANSLKRITDREAVGICAFSSKRAGMPLILPKWEKIFRIGSK